MPLRRLLRSRSWPSRLVRVFAALLVAAGLLLAGVWFFGGPVLSRYVTGKLKATVEQQLNARLEIGYLKYRFPYQVEVQNAALYNAVPGQDPIKLVGFDRLDLTLAKLPVGRGPLVIQRIDVTRPTVYVVETKQDGFIGLDHLLKNPVERKNAAAPNLSEVLRLRHVTLSGARVEYDDRTISKSVPFVWDKLGFAMNAVPHDYDAPYHFDASAGNGDTAKVQVSGTMDLDQLLLTVDGLTLETRLVQGQRVSPLPAGVQRVLNTLHVSGTGRATIKGVVPLLHTLDTDLSGDFVIDDAQGKLSPDRSATPLADLNVTGRVKLHGRNVRVVIGAFSCRRGPLGFSMAEATTIDYALATDRWTATPIRAALAYVPPADADGPLRQRMTAALRLQLAELSKREDFRADLTGTTIDLPESAGGLLLNGGVRYDDDGITLETVRVGGFGGPVAVDGVVNDTGGAFAGEIDVRQADTEKVYRLLSPGGDSTLTGKLDAHVRGAATEDFANVRGDGRFKITGGAFGRVPVLGGISQTLGVGTAAFIAHEAGGRFTLWPKKATFGRVAVSTSVLSAVGTGDYFYDGSLDLSVYADGHWNDGPRTGGLYIPVLSEIGRALAATGAYTVGSISRQFTHFTVTGTRDKPLVKLSPAPVIGESFEKLFGKDEDER